VPIPDPASLVLQAEYDFLIVGSGGASMCAALRAHRAGLRVAILEKRDVVGGSTGFSGGVWWVPNSPVIKRAGVEDSEALAYRYFEAVVGDAGKGANPARRKAFIEQAPEMVAFLEREGMLFEFADGWSDYYDERPGGQARGRSLLAAPFNLKRLGPWREKLSLYAPFRILPLSSYTLMQMTMFMRTWKARRILLRLVATILFNKLTGRDVVASGGSIQGRMLEMTLQRGIPIFTGFHASRFVEENGRITGVEGLYRGVRKTVRGLRGVLLNTGGFARNEAMRQKYQRQPTSAQWTNANPGDTGEMLEAAIALGAATEHLDTAVWVPTSLNPDLSLPAGAVDKQGNEYPFMHNTDIVSPHTIMVRRDGTRYINEGQSYMEIGETMYEKDAIPTFAIWDSRHLKRYGWGPMMPGTKPVRKWLESGYLVKADSLAELAAKTGINEAGLAAQVARFNAYARSGIDAEFQRGARAYDRFRGDPTVKPNPCLGEISRPPFYAVRMYPADVGTFGGLVTDERARVVRKDGTVIEGLYAAGNCTSSVMGRSYPGAGASISASFAFGYIAAGDVVGVGVPEQRATVSLA